MGEGGGVSHLMSYKCIPTNHMLVKFSNNIVRQVLLLKIVGILMAFPALPWLEKGGPG